MLSLEGSCIIQTPDQIISEFYNGHKLEVERSLLTQLDNPDDLWAAKQLKHSKVKTKYETNDKSYCKIVDYFQMGCSNMWEETCKLWARSYAYAY